jgi:hypothetical protein
VNSHNGSPFRAAALEQYARADQADVSVRRPAGARLVVLWVLLVLALAAGGAWLMVAWRYLAG